METEPDVLRAGILEVPPEGGLAVVGGRSVVLTVREHHLLVALLARVGRVVSRPHLYRQVWGRELRDGDRSIDVYVHKLRVKLEDAAPGVRFIHTHVGFGYRLEPTDAQGSPGGSTT